MAFVVGHRMCRRVRLGFFLSTLILIGTEAPVLAQPNLPSDCDLLEMQRMNTGYGDFGGSIAIDGLVMVIGAAEADVNGLDNTGAALVYEQGGQGRWHLVATLVADDAEFGYRFGASVAVEGDTIVVGASSARGGVVDTGAAYVFRRDPQEQWLQRQKLIAPDGATYDSFGDAVALSGDSLIIGAPGDDDLGGLSGSAYFYSGNSEGQWEFVNKVHASDGGSVDQFGSRVSLSGEWAIVSAYWNSGGAAYLFSPDAQGTWSERELLRNPSGTGAMFGWAVDIDADRALVTDYSGSGGGWAFVYQHDGNGTWPVAAMLQAWNHQPLDGFGRSAAISGDTIAVGTSGNGYYGEGTAYVFRDQGANQWTFARRLVPSNYWETRNFGMTIGVDGEWVVVGDFIIRSAFVYHAADPRCLPIMRREGECPGEITLRVINATPSGQVGLLYGLGWHFTVPNGHPCAGTRFEIGDPAMGFTLVRADEAGAAELTFNAGSNICDRLRVQAIDLPSCQVTNFVKIR